MGPQGFIHFVIIVLNISISRICSLRMSKKSIIVPVATVQNLMDRLPEVNLHRLRRHESVVAKIAILSLASSEGNDVGCKTKTRSRRSRRVWLNQVVGKVCCDAHLSTDLKELDAVPEPVANRTTRDGILVELSSCPEQDERIFGP